MQHCRLVLGPPYLGLSRQLMHFAQSSSIKQPLHCPQRRERTPPTVYRLKIFLFLNLWPFPLPLLLRWMFSSDTTHWALSLSVRSSSSSATSGGERERMGKRATNITLHTTHIRDARTSVCRSHIYLWKLKMLIHFSGALSNKQAWFL